MGGGCLGLTIQVISPCINGWRYICWLWLYYAYIVLLILKYHSSRNCGQPLCWLLYSLLRLAVIMDYIRLSVIYLSLHRCLLYFSMRYLRMFVKKTALCAKAWWYLSLGVPLYNAFCLVYFFIGGLKLWTYLQLLYVSF